MPCARAEGYRAEELDFRDYSITFDSAIFSGDVSTNICSDKPFILAAADSDIISESWSATILLFPSR
ncbi:MAG: hypothetical protein IPK68_23165 [Bdellovibrionales bacterium]|nr:hypothetical protein [Bdellovibrionales bacterium]